MSERSAKERFAKTVLLPKQSAIYGDAANKNAKP
jgi:hypothetical protein